MYTFLILLIYLSFISLGLPDSLLASAWPIMHSNLNVPVSYMGIITMVISVSTIVSSLFSYHFISKYKTGKVTIASVFITAFAMIGFSICNNFYIMILIAIPYGLGAGAIDAALNNYVAIHYSSRHMSWLHCFWGVGTVISPAVMNYAIKNFSWNYGYLFTGLIQLCIAIVLLMTIGIWRINKEEYVKKENEKTNLLKVLKIKGVPYVLCGFGAYCAAESTAMNWAGTYFFECKNVSASDAAIYASLVFIGITLGRFLSGFIANRFSDLKMIEIGSIISIIGILMIIPDDIIYSIIGFCMIGFGYAPIYPSIVHATPDNYGQDNSSAVIGFQMASAYLGSTLMSPFYGFLGRYFGYGIMPFFLLFFVVLMTLSIEKSFNKSLTSYKKSL